jgi:hypothetical protein
MALGPGGVPDTRAGRAGDVEATREERRRRRSGELDTAGGRAGGGGTPRSWRGENLAGRTYQRAGGTSKTKTYKAVCAGGLPPPAQGGWYPGGAGRPPDPQAGQGRLRRPSWVHIAHPTHRAAPGASLSLPTHRRPRAPYPRPARLRPLGGLPGMAG